MELERRLENASNDLSYLPSDVERRDSPELLYTVCPRDVGSFNSVHRCAAKDPMVEYLVQRVVVAHAGVKSYWYEKPSCRSDALERCLADVGYVRKAEYHAHVAETASWTGRPSVGVRVERVQDMKTLLQFESLLDTVFGKRGDLSESDLKRYLEASTGPDARTARFFAVDPASGRAVAGAALTMNREHDIAMLWAGSTLPEFRGRGLYSALVSARMAFLRENGISACGLYANIETSGPIVAKQGFQRFGRMTEWVK